ncbi:MAG: hypothetical protein B6D59_02290 [Campylobacteraceae bacterium 4484_4]|nr:MAG: hypothetical protein B6D59_02290 [Campylobacteraceae bacterium 4484_4]
MYQEAWDLIKKSRHILLVSHIHPDGDTLGSAVALYEALRGNGIKTTLFNRDALPFKYDYLSAYTKFRSKLPEHYDLIISSDSSSFDRLGLKSKDAPLINIDHHRSNTRYGDINLIQPHFSSATLVILEMLEYEEIPINRPIANAIYTGLAEDTGFFSYENVNEHAFICATKLVGCGADPALVGYNLKERNPLSKLRLSARVIDTMQLHRNGTISSAVVTQEMFRQTGADRSESDHLANLLRSLATVNLAILLIEESDGGYKISLRSKGRIDVSKIALSFGGGGHCNAAGFETTERNPEKILQQILQKVER